MSVRAIARGLVVDPGARRALLDGVRGTVELAFEAGGGYVRLGEHAVLIAPARSPVGPLSLLVAPLPPGAVVPGDPAAVAGGALVVGRLRIGLDAARATAAPRAGALASGWRAALGAALAVVPPAPADLAPGLGRLSGGDIDAGVAQLAGRGEGLTPAGDDLLAGFAAWRWADGAPVTLTAEGCGPLGRVYLRCAERGELPIPAARTMEAIRAADRRAAAHRARGLASWGASSGAALLWGMAAAAGSPDARDSAVFDGAEAVAVQARR